MDDEQLIQLIRKYGGSLTLSAESFVALMLAALKARNETLTEASEPHVIIPRKKIGRPVGAKDKKPRKRRKASATTDTD